MLILFLMAYGVHLFVRKDAAFPNEKIIERKTDEGNKSGGKVNTGKAVSRNQET